MQLTVVDSLQTHPELLQVVEIVQFREAMSERGEDYQVAFIEGSCTRLSDEPRLQKDPPAGRCRGSARHLRAFGRCYSLKRCTLSKKYASMFMATRLSITKHMMPARLKLSFRWISPYPGCPIDRDEFLACVKALFAGRNRDPGLSALR